MVTHVRCGASPAIWDHPCYLTYVNTLCFNSRQAGQHSLYLFRRNGRLVWLL